MIMKIITHNDIIQLGISPEQCYQWTVDMIKNKNVTILPPKISMKPYAGVFWNVMPSIISSKCGGVKIVNRYPQNTPSLDSKILLFDVETGRFKALIDANWITAMRTGAVAAHSITLFAKNGYSEIGMIGLGNTARATLLTLTAIAPDKHFHVKLLKYKGQERLFADRFVYAENVEFSYVDTYEEVIRYSDVVVSAATYLPNDIYKDEQFDEGILIIPIHTLGFTNCDLFFDKVFADDYKHVCHFKNFDKFHSFAEVSDVLSQKANGRENDKERIIVYNIGISIHDINFAANIYQLLKDRIKDINLYEPLEKFWI